MYKGLSVDTGGGGGLGDIGECVCRHFLNALTLKVI